MENLKNNYKNLKKSSDEKLSLFVENTKACYQLYADNQGKFGIMGLNIDLVSEITEENQTNITDHYIEGNVARQDNITLTPTIINITGYITELKYNPSIFNKIVKTITSGLAVVGLFKNTFTTGKQAIENLLKPTTTEQDYINNSEDLFSVATNLLTGMTAQAIARNFIKSLQQSRTAVNLLTPWGYIKNYYILSASFSQSNTRDSTLIKLTLKECLFTSTKYSVLAIEQIKANLQKQAKESTGISKSNNKVNVK